MKEMKEIMPIGFNLMVEPYVTNPYMSNETKGGLKLSDGEFFNPDSGEKDKLKQDLICAKVIEVGHKCEFVKEGDEVIFDVRVSKPIPFMNKGFLLTNEPNILCVINENLKERRDGAGS